MFQKICITVDGFVKTLAALDTPDMRDEWENLFNEKYIQPVLEEVDEGISSAMKAITNDSKYGCKIM